MSHGPRMPRALRRKFNLKFEMLEEKQLLAADVGGDLARTEFANDPFSPLAFPLEEMLDRTKTHPYIDGQLSVGFRFDNAIARGVTLDDDYWQDELGDVDLQLWEIGMDYERPDGTSVTIVDLTFSPDIPVTTAMQELADAPFVVWTSPAFFYDSLEDPREFVPNDPRYGDQYHHPLMQNDLAWDITTGDASVMIAVTDDGVDRTHDDLAPNIWQNGGEIAQRRHRQRWQWLCRRR